MTTIARLRARLHLGFWTLAAQLHRLDFALLLPLMARLPLRLAFRLAALRGQLNARTGRDWRSMALGTRHIRRQSIAGYRLLPVVADDRQYLAWSKERFVVEARDEFEARLVAAGRVNELTCRSMNVDGGDFLGMQPTRPRGLLLLTPHYDSFFVGVAFAAKSGAIVNLMSSAVTHDPRVDPAVQEHFSAKYRGLESSLNGGRVLDMEEGIRPFYRMLERGETLVVLGDAPVLPNGVAAQVNFLGALRLIAGGALRLAEKTGCDIGGYICRMERPGHYVMEWCEPGPADDPRTVERVYALFTRAILEAPGRWWASDLLPAMPPCAPAPPAPPDYAVLMLSDSPLFGSQELAHGIRCLQRQWPGTVAFPSESAPVHSPAPFGWMVCPRDQAPPLTQVLAQPGPNHLLVVLDPALLATAELPSALAACLNANEYAVCALADDSRFATGEWAPGYSTQIDFERYVERRAALPLCVHVTPPIASKPLAYMLRLDRLRAQATSLSADWVDLPLAMGLRLAVLQAPRAFVHSYAKYQQGDRTEMLDLLPQSTRRLLDVGGGEGGFARAFMRHRGGEALLVEPGARAAQRAKASGLQVFNAGIEQLDPQEIGPIDAISFLDVLEHLIDPLSALVTARNLLKPGGTLLVSVPNVGYWPVVRDLMAGRMDYLPVGILCQTHLRFFTAHSLAQLLGDAGFEVMQLRRHGSVNNLELDRFLHMAHAAGLTCDRDNLATESLHALARAR